MRSFAVVVLASLALVVSASSQQRVAELYILNAAHTVKDTAVHTVASEDLSGVLGHVFGVSSLTGAPAGVALPKSSSTEMLQQGTKGHLLIAVEDSLAADKSTINNVAQYVAVSDRARTHAELLSELFGSSKDFKNVMSVQSAMLDLDPNALVVAVGSEYMLLSAISSKNLANVEILLHSNANAGLKAPFSTLAKALVQAQNVPMGNVFDMSELADRTFARELSALVAFVPLIKANPELKALVADGHADLFTFVFSGLRMLRESYGADSQQYLAAWDQFSAVVPQVSSAFAQLYSQRASSSLLLLDNEPAAAARSARNSADSSLGKRTPSITSNKYVSLYSCYSSAESVSAATNNCSSNGTPTVYKEKTGRTDQCFTCQCNNGYIGESCEFQDMSVPFWIIFSISATLTVTLLLVSVGLAYMDPGNNTLLRTGQQPSRPKSD